MSITHLVCFVPGSEQDRALGGTHFVNTLPSKQDDAAKTRILHIHGPLKCRPVFASDAQLGKKQTHLVMLIGSLSGVSQVILE